MPALQEGRRLSLPSSAQRIGCSALLYFERVGVTLGALGFLRDGNKLRSLALATMFGASYLTRITLRARLRARAEGAFYRDAVAAVLAKPLAHSKEAEIEALVLGNAHTVAQHEADTIPSLWAEALAAATLTIVLGFTQPVHTLLAVFLAAAGGGLAAVVAKGIAQRESTRGWKRFTEVLRFLMSSVLGRVELAAHGESDTRLLALEEKLAIWRLQAFRIEWLTGLASRGSLAVALVVGALILAATAHPSLETVAIALLLLQPFAGVVQRILETVRTRDVRQTLAHLLRMPEMAASRAPCPQNVSVLAFRDWTGGYVEGRDALTITELVLDRGEGALLLGGANGSGKSTLLRSLVGLLGHQRGTLTIDGVSLTSIDANDWKHRVAYLPQRPHMPAQGTIREAFAFLHPSADDAALRTALSRVELDVELDGDVNALSAGQRQRLAIARVLLRDADVVLLDEPDQNLDRRGLQLLTTMVRELAPRRLLIIAAHDPEILAIEGRHLSLDKGLVVGDSLTAPASGGNRRSLASA